VIFKARDSASSTKTLVFHFLIHSLWNLFSKRNKADKKNILCTNAKRMQKPFFGIDASEKRFALAKKDFSFKNQYKHAPKILKPLLLFLYCSGIECDQHCIRVEDKIRAIKDGEVFCEAQDGFKTKIALIRVPKEKKDLLLLQLGAAAVTNELIYICANNHFSYTYGYDCHEEYPNMMLFEWTPDPIKWIQEKNKTYTLFGDAENETALAAEDAICVILQSLCSVLQATESKFQFNYNDLHYKNILIEKTKSLVTYTYKLKRYSISIKSHFKAKLLPSSRSAYTILGNRYGLERKESLSQEFLVDVFKLLGSLHLVNREPYKSIVQVILDCIKLKSPNDIYKALDGDLDELKTYRRDFTYMTNADILTYLIHHLLKKYLTVKVTIKAHFFGTDKYGLGKHLFLMQNHEHFSFLQQLKNAPRHLKEQLKFLYCNPQETHKVCNKNPYCIKFDEKILLRDKIIGSGSYGDVFVAEFKDSSRTKLAVKQIKSPLDAHDLAIEVLSGLVINEFMYLFKNNNFVYTYGYACPNPKELPNKMLTELLVQPINWITYRKEQKKYILYGDSKGETPLTINDAINIVFETLCSVLQATESKFKFNHYDLYFQNILVQQTKEEKVYTYHFKDYTFSIKSKFKAKILDFGLSSFTLNKERHGHEKLTKYFDASDCEFLMDVFRFIASIYRTERKPYLEIAKIIFNEINNMANANFPISAMMVQSNHVEQVTYIRDNLNVTNSHLLATLINSLKIKNPTISIQVKKKELKILQEKKQEESKRRKELEEKLEKAPEESYKEEQAPEESSKEEQAPEEEKALEESKRRKELEEELDKALEESSNEEEESKKKEEKAPEESFKRRKAQKEEKALEESSKEEEEELDKALEESSKEEKALEESKRRKELEDELDKALEESSKEEEESSKEEKELEDELDKALEDSSKEEEDSSKEKEELEDSAKEEVKISGGFNALYDIVVPWEQRLEKLQNSFLYFVGGALDLRLWEKSVIPEIMHRYESKVTYPAMLTLLPDITDYKIEKELPENSIDALYPQIRIDAILPQKKHWMHFGRSDFFIEPVVLTALNMFDLYGPFPVWLQTIPRKMSLQWPQTAPSFIYQSWAVTNYYKQAHKDFSGVDSLPLQYKNIDWRLASCEELLHQYLSLKDQAQTSAMYIYHNDQDFNYRDTPQDQVFYRHIDAITKIKTLTLENIVELNEELMHLGASVQEDTPDVLKHVADVVQSCKLTPCPPYPTIKELELFERFDALQVLVVKTHGGFWIVSRVCPNLAVESNDYIYKKVQTLLYSLLYLKTNKRHQHGPSTHFEHEALQKELFSSINTWLKPINLRFDYYSAQWGKLPKLLALDSKQQTTIRTKKPEETPLSPLNI
jgi:chemotaxis protein histidine kinase CheA